MLLNLARSLAYHKAMLELAPMGLEEREEVHAVVLDLSATLRTALYL